MGDAPTQTTAPRGGDGHEEGVALNVEGAPSPRPSPREWTRHGEVTAVLETGEGGRERPRVGERRGERPAWLDRELAKLEFTRTTKWRWRGLPVRATASHAGVLRSVART